MKLQLQLPIFQLNSKYIQGKGFLEKYIARDLNLNDAYTTLAAKFKPAY